METNPDKVFHNWFLNYLKGRLSRDYRDIKMNPEGEKNEPFRDYYPDLILGNHGMVLAVMEVETEQTIDEERARYWKGLSQAGVKLILMVPEQSKAKVTDLLWKQGMMHNVSVGSYSVRITMP